MISRIHVPEPSRIKIYYADGQFDEILRTVGFNKFNTPFRVTTDDRGYLYVGDLGGGGNGRV